MATPIVPTLITLPDELRGSRILLRPYHADDAVHVFAAIDESREHLWPWLGWADRHMSIDDTHDYCIRCAAKWLLRTDLTVGIFKIDSGEFLGGTGLHDPNWDARSFEIGYWLKKSAVGHGYATEATRLLSDFALADLRAWRVMLRCDSRNDASRRVAERAGFQLEGCLRNGSLTPDGSIVDTLVFARVPEESA